MGYYDDVATQNDQGVYTGTKRQWVPEPGDADYPYKTAAQYAAAHGGQAPSASLAQMIANPKAALKPQVSRMGLAEVPGTDTGGGYDENGNPANGGVYNPPNTGASATGAPGATGGSPIPVTLVNGQTGERTQSTNIGEINDAAKNGFDILKPDGSKYEVRNFAEGILLDGNPINVIVGQGWLPGQQEALKQAGINPSTQTQQIDKRFPGNQPGSSGGEPATQPRQTNAGTPPVLNDDVSKMIQQLQQYGLDRTKISDLLTQAGLDQTAQATDQLNRSNNVGNYIFEQSKNNAIQRDSLIDQLYSGQGAKLDADGNPIPGTAQPGMVPTLQGYLSRANTSLDDTQGLDQASMSALRSEATSGISDRFNKGMEQAKVELARRGALGGQLPGSTGDLLRAYGPLMAQRDALVAQANRVPIIENANRKQQNYQLAQQLGQGATGQMGGLMSSVGNIYNPTPYLSNTLSALNSGTSALNAGTSALAGANSGFNAGTSNLSNVGSLAQTQMANQPGSLWQVLAAAGAAPLLSSVSSGSGGTTNGGSKINIIPNITLGGGGRQQ